MIPSTKLTRNLAKLMLVAVLFVSCQENQTKSINSLGKFPYNSNVDELTIIEIDNCEYIVCNSFKNKDITITHKGNCKFCLARSAK